MIVNGERGATVMNFHVCSTFFGLLMTLVISSSLGFARYSPRWQDAIPGSALTRASTSDEIDAFHNPNVFNAFKMIEQAFYIRYPCPVRSFEPLSYRYRRESKDKAIIMIRGVVTTNSKVEDFVHLEIEDNRPRKMYVLFGVANRKREVDRLPDDEVINTIRPCPRKKRDKY